MRLCSLYHAGDWPPQKRMRADLRPSKKNTNGLYAWKRDVPVFVFPGIEAVYKDFVFGAVSLWGHYVEHEEGYRAEYAYPYEIKVFDPALVQPLRDLYAVDVILATRLDFPRPVVFAE